MTASKIAHIICCGCCCVIKVAEETPLSVLFLAEIIKQIFPPGVVNIITGYGNVAGEAMIRHAAMDKLSFTGSLATGKRIMSLATMSG